MSDLQSAKEIVRRLHDQLDAADPAQVGAVLGDACAPDCIWRGVHPFGERSGPTDVADAFWRPLREAMPRMQRRPDIFIAGMNDVDEFQSIWVISMGHLMGLFDRPWLGIPPTRRIAMLRYAEFNRVQDGGIVETAMFVDIPHLMMQAGRNPFPPQTGAMLVQPGPRTHDGLCYDAQDPERGRAALAAINALLLNPRASLTGETEAARLARVWSDDMIWWGPAGIGATFTIDRYLDQHSTPFGVPLADGYRFNGHKCRIAEGDYGGFFGWPNLTVRNAGGFMGMPAGGAPADMRVVDIYRVAGNRLVENWVFIDMLHFLAMQGLDVLARMAAIETGGG